HTQLQQVLDKLQAKGKIADAAGVLSRIRFVNEMNALQPSGLVIEAIVEQLEVKQQVFAGLEAVVDEGCILATNTSSLSVTSIASACKNPSRVIGLHFF